MFFYPDLNGTRIIVGGKTVGTIDEFRGNLTQYMIRDDSPRRLDEVFSGDWSSYACVSTGQTPQIIEYFYMACIGDIGCGHERRAVVCGNAYFVEDFTSSYGPRLFGPYFIEK